MAKTLDAEQVREQILAFLKSSPRHEARPRDVQLEIYGDTDDLDEHRRRQQRMFHAVRSLIKSKHITKRGHGNSTFISLNNGRPAPEIADIPENGRKGRPRGSYNKKHKSNGNGEILLYVIRDLKSKLSELEAMIEA